MKKTTKTITREYNEQGKLIKETETTIEEEILTQPNSINTPWTTQISKPNVAYLSDTISGTGIMDCKITSNPNDVR